MHRVACSDEWCGEQKESNGHQGREQQQDDKGSRYSQLLFLRSSPSALLDPLLPLSSEVAGDFGALLDPLQVEGRQAMLQHRSSAMIEGQDVVLGTTALAFENFVLRERAVKTGRAM
jgi:hypothetical protein